MFRSHIQKCITYLKLTLHANKSSVCNKICVIHTNYVFRRNCLKPASEGIFFFSIVHKSMLIKLVRMRNIVMAFDIKLLKKGMLMIVGTHTALGNAY